MEYYDIVQNPRKENGDLGDLKCDWCGKTSGVYAKIRLQHNEPDRKIVIGSVVCKGCLFKCIDDINEGIKLWFNKNKK